MTSSGEIRFRNPFRNPLVAELIDSPELYRQMFSESILVGETLEVFQPTNTVLLGPQGTGKSMILNLIRYSVMGECLAETGKPLDALAPISPFLGISINLVRANFHTFGRRSVSKALFGSADQAVDGACASDFLLHYLFAEFLRAALFILGERGSKLRAWMGITQDSLGSTEFARALATSESWFGYYGAWQPLLYLSGFNITAFLVLCGEISLLEIKDPEGACPDHSGESARRRGINRQQLVKAAVGFREQQCDLLADQDFIMDIFTNAKRDKAEVFILDITALPKRYFCFFLRLLMEDVTVSNVVVTYSEASPDGYTPDPLAEDPMSVDHLPGFAGPPPPKGGTLVVGIGFEALSLLSIVEGYGEKRRQTKYLLPFPPGLRAIRRQWRTLQQLSGEEVEAIVQENIEVIAAWDAEQVYKRLSLWHDDSVGLTLAPFGPKPHSFGMALFAISHDCGMFYTQPKSYSPDYSTGRGRVWGYVPKWDGVCCYDRKVQQL